MTRLNSLIIAMLLTNAAFAQSKNQQLVSADFQKSYNEKAYDELFGLFSAEMKLALPVEKTSQFFADLSKQTGSITQMEYISQQGSYALYKTRFEKAVMGVNISLNDQHQINGFFIKPYEEPKEGKNRTVDLLGSYPKEIAAIIFSASKDLPNKAQLSIAIIRNGKTSFYGIEKLNDTIRPAENQNKVFEIGSITKVFTATVLASLVTEKKIRLTDEINTFFPFAFKDSLKLTFLNLANHTSGLPRLPENLDAPDPTNPYRAYDRAKIEKYLKTLASGVHGTDRTYAYSNLGAGLLGYSLSLSQNTTFQVLLQKRVFDKYKMTSSVTSPNNLGNRLIRGLDKKGEEVANWDFDVLFGAGGALSTSQDLAKFASAQFDSRNKELELTRRTTFDIKDDTKIALGWHQLLSPENEDVFWHNGGTGGYTSSIVMKVKDRSAVVILSNIADISDKIDPLSYALLSLPAKK